MGYRLVVWEGTRPHDDIAGGDEYEEVVGRYLATEPVEPTPAIRRFVAELTEFWTDDPHDPRWADSPWKDWPLLEGASGPALGVHLIAQDGALRSCIVASIAEKHRLVCFDPQVDLLRPVSEEIVAQMACRWAGQLN